MFILLNGSFGIGKTTVARRLVHEMPGLGIYDPERIGSVLRHLPPWLLGLNRRPEDYQDLSLWRRLVARGARRRHGRTGTVLVPMAFSNLAYFEELGARLAPRAPVHALCLVAPLATVQARLERRAEAEGRAVTAWESRHAALCCAAHVDARYGRPMDATATPEEVAAAIIASLPLEARR